MTSGKAAGRLASAASASPAIALLLLGRLHLVALGQHDLIGHRRPVEQVHHLAVGVLQSVAAIDQQKTRAASRGRADNR